MSTENSQNEEQEIDLSQLSKRVENFFEGIFRRIFKSILFVKKNRIIFGSLILFGFISGYVLDNNNNQYDSDVIVKANMGGVDYLYSKIDLLSSKLKEGDFVFLKSIGLKNPEKIALIEIEPVIDIYSFVNNNTAIANNAQNTQNFELMKLLAESSDIDKVIKDKITSKNYPHHKIHIITISKTSVDELIKPLLKYLNTDDYLNQILEVSNENLNIKMKKNKELIAQTDSLIKILTYNLSKNQKSANLVYNNENNQFNSFFELKNNLINEIAAQKIEMINCKTFIKDMSTVVNIKNTKGVNGKMKLVLPFLLIVVFISISFLRSFYKRGLVKYNQ